jgi:hypothetical protein
VSRIGAALLGAAALLSGCTYYNTLYNAERLYQEAERHRYAGRDSLAQAGYREVIRKTADAYRGGSSDERIGQTLFLLGRAQLRAGDLQAARLALTEAELRASDPGLRPEILIYLAMAEARLGEAATAVARLGAALADTSVTDVARAEARLLRGSLNLVDRSAATAWVDLDQAGVVPGVDIDAGLERLRLSIRHDEPERARAALAALLATRAAGESLDTIAVLLRAAAARWGPATAGDLLATAADSRWEQPARGRMRLELARLRHEAGDTAAAFEGARVVGSGRGEAGTEARLLLAGWRLRSARDLGAAASVRPVLLPAGDDPRAEALLVALDDVERYSGLGLDEHLAWFAAAEIARDRLGAPVLARGLFLAYADIDSSAPWAPKALLAALDVSPDEEGDREWLRGRLEAHRDSPYVLAARGRSPAGFDALEEELAVRLREITVR